MTNKETLPTAEELMQQGASASLAVDEPKEPEETGITLNQIDLVHQFKDTSLPDTTRANAFGRLIDGQTAQIAAIMPPHLTIKRLREVFVLQLKQTPKLMNCEPVSLMQAAYQAAVLGLEPYATMGEFYIVPYGKEAQVIPGYKGLRKLAMNSGELSNISAHVVYEKEYEQGRFEINYGTSPSIEHKPLVIGARGNVIGAYAVARFIKPELKPVVEFMTLKDIQHVRASSNAGNSGPWVQHFGEMSRKTVLRRLIKSLPLSVTPKSLATALEIDSASHNGQTCTIDTGTGDVVAPRALPAQENKDIMEIN